MMLMLRQLLGLHININKIWKKNFFQTGKLLACENCYWHVKTDLHSTDAYAEVIGSGGTAFVHLALSLLLRCIVTVLPCSHLKVQDTRQVHFPSEVLQQYEL